MQEENHADLLVQMSSSHAEGEAWRPPETDIRLPSLDLQMMLGSLASLSSLAALSSLSSLTALSCLTSLSRLSELSRLADLSSLASLQALPSSTCLTPLHSNISSPRNISALATPPDVSHPGSVSTFFSDGPSTAQLHISESLAIATSSGSFLPNREGKTENLQDQDKIPDEVEETFNLLSQEKELQIAHEENDVYEVSAEQESSVTQFPPADDIITSCPRFPTVKRTTAAQGQNNNSSGAKPTCLNSSFSTDRQISTSELETAGDIIADDCLQPLTIEENDKSSLRKSIRESILGVRPSLAKNNLNRYEDRIERLQRSIFDFYRRNPTHKNKVGIFPSYFPGTDGLWAQLQSKSKREVKAKKPQITNYADSWTYHLRNINSECCSVLSYDFSLLKPYSLFYAIILDKWSRVGDNDGYVGYIGKARRSIEKQLQTHRKEVKRILHFFQSLVKDGLDYAAYQTTSLFELLLARNFLEEGNIVDRLAIFAIYSRIEEEDDDIIENQVNSNDKSRLQRISHGISAVEEKERRKQLRGELREMSKKKIELFALNGLLGANA